MIKKDHHTQYEGPLMTRPTPTKLTANRIGRWSNDWAKSISGLLPHYLESTDSTNNSAKNMAAVQGKNQLIVTDYQTHGRGRGTNTWISPQKGSALLSSWIFDLDFTPQPILPALVGLSIFEALEAAEGFRDISLKAPNDIYMQNKKVCGILIENISQGKQNRLVVGVGMNVFDVPQVDTSSCIQSFREKDIDEIAWNHFLDVFYQNLKNSVQESKRGIISEAKRERLLAALNGFPLLKEKYLEVLPSAEIKTAQGTIHWSEL